MLPNKTLHLTPKSTVQFSACSVAAQKWCDTAMHSREKALNENMGRRRCMHCDDHESCGDVVDLFILEYKL
jgi:hypothetical protein